MVLDPVTLGLTAGINAIATNLMKVSIESSWNPLLRFSKKTKEEFTLNFAAPAKEYAAKYYKRHGLVKTLGMNEPVYLDKLYINVQVLKEDLARCFDSLDSQEALFRKQRSQSFHFGNNDKRPGLEIANERQYLMVLGGPGIGKTTFLRKIGLEALKGKKGSYQHDLIPVLLELRLFRDGTIDLKQAIAQEFANCGLSNYEKCTEKLLTDGKLLILLDALDEVPTDRTAEMVGEIQDFVDQYSENRFIASCRIAAYRNTFQRFTDITIADFDDNQIQNFIANWFLSHDLVEWGKVCWEKLNSDEHRSTKELAHTPLLLTLICIIHKKTGNFPANKATLYERALQVLLEEWDASKQISRESLYKGWDSKRKTLMLAEVAHTSFVENKLFFQGQEIAKLIEAVIKEMLPDEKLIDGKKVIRDIETQHGILVARDEGIYSFSHLTIQEYLTAYHIVENDEIQLNSLVDSYLLDRNWREVFILIAGIKQPDRLLQAMETRIHDCMTTEKLQNLLVWVANITNPNAGNLQPLGKRALAYANANAYAIAYAIADADAYDRAFANAFAANTIANAIAYERAIAYDRVIADSYAYAIVNASLNVYANTIYSFIRYAQSASQDDVYQSIDLSKLINDLDLLELRIPNDEQLRQQFTQKLIQTWLQAFQLAPEMLEFDQSELKAIDNYLYAIKLIIDCRKAAVRVNTSAWGKIESRLLMPKSLHQY
jgi:NACHT domain